MEIDKKAKEYSVFSMVVWVAALGNFVDTFDLLLFGMIRTASLKDIGITSKVDIERFGLMLDNCQMLGMLFGGLFWGIMGDKKGRISVLFGSIITYTIANILNGFVQNVDQYAILRFVAGFGLAGELGAGVTLVNEVLTKEKRGYGTMLVASIGIMGAVFGGFMVKWVGAWRTCYFIGGGFGIILLLLRFSVMESGMFNESKGANVMRGNFKLLFSKKKIWQKYIGLILIGIPMWYIVQMYAKYSPELLESTGKYTLSGDLRKQIPINGIMLTYFGLTVGDFLCSWHSEKIRSRKKAVLRSMITSIIAIGIFFALISTGNITNYYIAIFILGTCAGYWAVFMSVAAESFGTNIRSTVTGTVPNFVRGAVVLVNLGYSFFKFNLHQSAIVANLGIGTIVFIAAFWGWSKLDETYGKDLNYIEQ
ncbi:MFS transporter [Rhizosphaericola mali]|uniref:MFS transporter n=1 Tax=Rhizosphaericola mali TaxID=2545455 RepID=A0A5P2G2V3_9BACT|nr:MFS transporter [Rhizosphaericola mali]QES88152.1 MFS transporter [Rhizosphaericola mali]